MGTVLEVDGDRWSWLYGVMLQKNKRVQVLKCCPELLGPLLCSSPSSCGVALSCLSFPCSSPPPALREVEREGPSGSTVKGCKLLLCRGMGT